MKMILAAMTALLSLTGCSIHSISGDIAGIGVEVGRLGGHGYYGGGPGFCPPGHGMKGHC